MRASRLFARTLREAPAEAEAPSHRLLIRGAYIPALLAGETITAVTHAAYFAEHSTPARYLAGNLTLLRDPALRGRTYDLSGPDAYTFPEIAELLSKILGLEVKYVPVPPDDRRSALLGAGSRTAPNSCPPGMRRWTKGGSDR